MTLWLIGFRILVNKSYELARVYWIDSKGENKSKLNFRWQRWVSPCYHYNLKKIIAGSIGSIGSSSRSFFADFSPPTKIFLSNFFFQACKTTLTLFAELDEIKFLQKYFFPLLASSFFLLGTRKLKRDESSWLWSCKEMLKLKHSYLMIKVRWPFSANQMTTIPA